MVALSVKQGAFKAFELKVGRAARYLIAIDDTQSERRIKVSQDVNFSILKPPHTTKNYEDLAQKWFNSDDFKHTSIDTRATFDPGRICRSVDHYIAHYLANPNQKLSALETTIKAFVPIEKGPAQAQTSSFDRRCREIQDQLGESFFAEDYFVQEFTKKVREEGLWEPIPETVSLDAFWNPKVAPPNKRQSKLFASYVQTIKAAERELSATGMSLIEAFQARVSLYQAMAAQPKDQWTPEQIARESNGFPISDKMAKSQLTAVERGRFIFTLKEETMPTPAQAVALPPISRHAKKQSWAAEPRLLETTTPTPPRPAQALQIETEPAPEPYVVKSKAKRIVTTTHLTDTYTDTYLRWVKKSDGSQHADKLIRKGQDSSQFFLNYMRKGDFITADTHVSCADVRDLQDFYLNGTQGEGSVPRARMTNDTDYKFENGTVSAKKRVENTPDGVQRTFDDYRYQIDGKRTSAQTLMVAYPNGQLDIYDEYKDDNGHVSANALIRRTADKIVQAHHFTNGEFVLDPSSEMRIG